MKTFDKKFLEAQRPDGDPQKIINWVLDQLYKDKTKTINDEVVPGLTFEELLGALLGGRDAVVREESECE